MLIVPINSKARKMSTVASPTTMRISGVLVPVVLINHLLNVVVIIYIVVSGTGRYAYTRVYIMCALGTVQWAQEVLCARS